jgi:copper chaperone CopZ
MKLLLASVLTAFALTVGVQAEDMTAKISDVHLCCKSCVKGVDTATAKIMGLKAVTDQDAGTVTLTGPDKDTIQKGAQALVDAGYFGTSSDVKMDPTTGATGKNVKSLKVTGVHLCCPKCVKTVDKVVKAVPGVESEDATKGAESFTVTGDFNDKAVFDALQKAGLTGKDGN